MKYQYEQNLPLQERIFKRSIPIPHCGCWLWDGAVSDKGYGNIKISGNVAKAHRISYECFVGFIPTGSLVCHKCDTPLCVNPDHLFIGTSKDNSDDKINKGRDNKASGSRHGRAKLTEAQVIDIRASKLPHRKIAAQYGVARSTIWNILNGSHWKITS